jgi:hypothetical protein
MRPLITDEENYGTAARRAHTVHGARATFPRQGTRANRNGARLGADIAIRLEERERFVETPDHQSQQKTRTGHPVLIGGAIGATAGLVLNATAYRTGESVCTGAALMAGIGAPSVPGSAHWFRAERFVCSLLHLGTM